MLTRFIICFLKKMNNSSLPRVGLYSNVPNPSTNLLKGELKGFLGIFYTFIAICMLVVIRYLALQTVLKNLLPKQATKKQPILLTVNNLENDENEKKILL